MSLCIIFRMKGGERFRTSDLVIFNTNRESDFCFDSSFFVVVFEEVGLCHAGCRCNPAAFWSQRSAPAYAVYDGVCVEPISDLNRGTFLSCRPRLLQITDQSINYCSLEPLRLHKHSIGDITPPNLKLASILGIVGSQLQVLGSSTLPLF